jgi:hypothetical protein
VATLTFDRITKISRVGCVNDRHRPIHLMLQCGPTDSCCWLRRASSSSAREGRKSRIADNHQSRFKIVKLGQPQTATNPVLSRKMRRRG